jgi:predicted nucleotide-binding protein (sugar kinase/HSP70/actin superfamily)
LRYKKSSEAVTVHMDELENKAKSLNIFNLTPFYNSSMFRNFGFHVDVENRAIVKTF